MPTSEPDVGAVDGTFHDEWVRALDALEQDVDAAEAMLHDRELPPPSPWTPPAVHGPLPQDLLPRARLLLDRQLSVSRQISGAMLHAGREHRLTGRLLQPAGPPSPVYLDLSV